METTPEQTAEGIALVRVLAAVLDRLVCANSPLALTDPGQITKFHALKAPGIGILQYLERINKYASCSNECFILALIYIDRLIQRNNFLLTELNVHRVVITAILLAAKFFDDAYYNNAYYAKVGGVLVSEMNGLEVDFLFRINFSLHVTPVLFQKYREELLSHSQAAVLAEVNHPPAVQVTPAVTPTSPAFPPHPVNGVTVQYHFPVQTDMEVDQKPLFTSHNHTGKAHPTYITPSPPQAVSQNVPVPLPSSNEPYLQRPSSMPEWHQGRCSPASTTTMYGATSEPYYVVEDHMACHQIHHGTLIHHNHAERVEHGFHKRHPEPYSDAHYMGAPHVLAADVRQGVS